MLTPEQIAQDVARALQEDVGPGDITAGLIPAERNARARVITREQAVLCGTQWFTETFRQLDPTVHIEWSASDGQRLEPDQELCRLNGPARSLVTGERTALNFLQCLSGTATAADATWMPWPAPARRFWTRAKRSPACGRPRNTPRPAAAAATTAWACTTPS